MDGNAEGSNGTTLSPDEAFATLGNETRIAILRALGDTEGPLSFTELRDRVGIRQGGQFNYHLDKLVGHFVGKTDAGYALRQPGRRVVQAILSEAVTGDPEIEPTEVDFACRHCNAPVEVRYSHGKARYSCRECGGNVGGSDSRYRGEWDDEVEPGNLGNETLPPAGIQGRTVEEVFRASGTWAHLDALSAAGDVCPRCAAPVDRSVRVCDDHDATDGHCDRCDSRRAVVVHFECTNCIYGVNYAAVMALLDDPELLSFVGEHGLNTTTDGIEWGWDYGEEVVSTDPFEARFTVTIDGDSITLTVDEDLDVVDVSR